MTDLANISDDDLMAEVVSRELHKHRGVFALMSESMLDYHAMWSGICAYAAKIQHRDGFMAPHVLELRDEILRLIDERPAHARMQSINTTYLGAEDRIHEIARAA